MTSSSLARALPFVLLVGTAWAVDHPIGGDRLQLRDATNLGKRRVTFKATADPAIDPAVADPTTAGATLEVFGTQPGDGSTGLLSLPASGWTALGKPAGSKGYRFRDRSVAAGVKTVSFRRSKRGGALVVAGGGPTWPYAVLQPQGGVRVRFTVGDDIWCAEFVTFQENQAGRVRARDATPPSSCLFLPPTTTTSNTLDTSTSTSDTTSTSSTSTSVSSTSTSTSSTILPTTTSTSTTSTSTVPSGTCGNGVVEGLEECDDGNTSSNDGCSATCQLEDTSAVCAGMPSTPGTALDAVRVASGLTKPTYLTSPRLDTRRLFVTEQGGFVRVIRDGVLLPTPFLDIHDEVSNGNEQGLLSIAFHPDYEMNGRFFVSYTALSTGSTSCANRRAGDSVIAEYQVSANPDVADESTRTELLRVPQPFANHNGGLIAFGPGNFLYLGLGDGGGGGDPCESAQNDAEALGKLLRIDVDNPPANPADAVWAKGLRNPWRWAFDRATDDLYVADVGQDLYEEIDVTPAPVPSGVNYGWDDREGRHCFEPMSGCPATGVSPVLEYCHFQTDPACGTHPRGCSITGGYVYRGCAMPDIRGRYFYSDFCGGFIRSFQGVAGGDAQNVVDHTSDLNPTIGGFTINSVTSFGEDARGEIYVVDQGGEIFKLVPGS